MAELILNEIISGKSSSKMPIIKEFPEMELHITIFTKKI